MAGAMHMVTRMDRREMGPKPKNGRFIVGAGALAPQNRYGKKNARRTQLKDTETTMKHTERVKAIANELSVPVSAVNTVWTALTMDIIDHASKNRDYTISLFATFVVGKRPGRHYWDERAGRYKNSKAKKVIKPYITPTLAARIKLVGFGV